MNVSENRRKFAFPPARIRLPMRAPSRSERCWTSSSSRRPNRLACHRGDREGPAQEPATMADQLRGLRLSRNRHQPAAITYRREVRGEERMVSARASLARPAVELPRMWQGLAVTGGVVILEFAIGLFDPAGTVWEVAAILSALTLLATLYWLYCIYRIHVALHAPRVRRIRSRPARRSATTSSRSITSTGSYAGPMSWQTT
jgi:hypothetical protein